MRLRLVLIHACCAAAVAWPLTSLAADPVKPEKASTKAPKPDAKPDAKPTRAEARAAANAPLSAELQSGVDALVAEYEPLLKSPAGAAPRTSSDYFTSSTATQAEIIAALNKRLHKNPRVDMYVKWQLLSAQKGVFEEAYAKEALKLYQRSPQPPSRPGTDPESQRQLTNQIAKLKKEEIESANEQWKEQADYHMLQFRPFLGYRDELYARLPRNLDLLSVAMNDLEERMNHGYDIRLFLRTVLNDMRSMAAAMPTADIKRLATVAQNLNGKMGPRVYEEIQFDEKAKKINWKLEAPNGFDKKTMQEVIDALELMAKSGG